MTILNQFHRIQKISTLIVEFKSYFPKPEKILELKCNFHFLNVFLVHGKFKKFSANCRREVQKLIFLDTNFQKLKIRVIFLNTEKSFLGNFSPLSFADTPISSRHSYFLICAIDFGKN